MKLKKDGTLSKQGEGGGHPPIFNSEEALDKACISYFVEAIANNEMCECGHSVSYHQKLLPTSQMRGCSAYNIDDICQCKDFHLSTVAPINPQKELLDTRMNMILDNAKMGIMPPYNPSTPSPMPTIDKYIESFREKFGRFYIGNDFNDEFVVDREPKTKEPLASDEVEKFFSHALQTYGEERYEEGKEAGYKKGYRHGEDLLTSRKGNSLVFQKGLEKGKFEANEKRTEIWNRVVPEAIEKAKTDGEAQGIRRAKEVVEKLREKVDFRFPWESKPDEAKEFERGKGWGWIYALDEIKKALLPNNE